MKISIRPASESDATGMVAILNPIIAAGAYSVIDELVTEVAQAHFIRSFPRRGILLVAVTDHGCRIVGIQDVIPRPDTPDSSGAEGDVSTFVALDLRARGIGSRLCEATVREARRRGYRTLRAAIRVDNTPALSFYQGRGFRIVGTERRLAKAGGADRDRVIVEMSLDER